MAMNPIKHATAIASKKKVDLLIMNTTHIIIPDSLVVCDLCNASFPEESDTEVPILQHRWGSDEPWTDVGTRCPDCQEGFEDLTRVVEV